MSNTTAQRKTYDPFQKAFLASDVTNRPINWLVPNLIPEGMLTIVAGRPGQGKSMFTAWLTAEISKQGKAVVYSNTEDPIREMSRPRLAAAGAKLNKVFFWHPIFAGPALDGTPSHEVEAFEDFIVANKVKLVVMDPIAAHIKGGSIYNDQAIRRIMGPVANVLERTQCACVAVVHMIKGAPRNGHPLEAIGGSSGGLVGAARAVYLFGQHPDETDQRVLAPAKMNFVAQEDFCSLLFQIDSEGDNIGRMSCLGETQDITASHIVSQNSVGVGAGQGHDRKLAAAEWLQTRLSLGPAKATQLEAEAKDVGITWRTLMRADAEVVHAEKARTGFGKGSFVTWFLPGANS